MTSADRVLCATTSRWLSASSRAVGTLGIGAAGVAAWLLLAPAPLPPWAAAVLLLVLVSALAERTLALRSCFDAGLFADLARAPGTLDLLDDALAALQLRTRSTTTRSLAERVRGARRLTLQHALLVLAQFSAVAVHLLLTAGATST